MTGRDRTQSEHDACGLPTRTIRVVCGRRTIEREMGSGRTEERLIEWLNETEVDELMREREAVNL